MQIDFKASEEVHEVIASLGRTEDVRFSPSNTRLAIAGFKNDTIALFDIQITDSSEEQRISLSNPSTISSARLKYPHGVDFIDDETIIVANRQGAVSILSSPRPGSNSKEPYEIGVDGFDLLDSPGSISITKKATHLYEVLICNNYIHTVTRHLLDSSAGYTVKSNEVLLRKRLAVPDGISLSRNGRWIAISNHNTHNVLIYENTPSLDESSDPVGVLRGAAYPHGVRFTSDDQFILVADAGEPYVYIYGAEGSGWRGVRDPLSLLSAMNEDVFLRGRYNPAEGGPKGIDADGSMKILAVTSEHQQLAFFDLEKLLKATASLEPNGSTADARVRTIGTLEANHREADPVKSELDRQGKLAEAERRAKVSERRCKQAEIRVAQAAEDERTLRSALDLAERRALRAKNRLASIEASNSWRITGPLRRAWSTLRKPGREPVGQ